MWKSIPILILINSCFVTLILNPFVYTCRLRFFDPETGIPQYFPLLLSVNDLSSPLAQRVIVYQILAIVFLDDPKFG